MHFNTAGTEERNNRIVAH